MANVMSWKLVNGRLNFCQATGLTHFKGGEVGVSSCSVPVTLEKVVWRIRFFVGSQSFKGPLGPWLKLAALKIDTKNPKMSYFCASSVDFDPTSNISYIGNWINRLFFRILIRSRPSACNFANKNLLEIGRFFTTFFRVF